MKFRIYLAICVVITTLAVIYGSWLGYWHWGFSFLPFIVGFSITFWGVVSIRSQMFVKAECDFIPNGKEVMLTFDDGPEPGKTEAILDLLEKYNSKAVFFLIGKKVDQHPEIVRLILEKGHVIGSHSYEHGFWFDTLPTSGVMADLQKAEQAIQNATGQAYQFFRPPYGITNPNIGKALKSFDYRTIGWNLRSFDTIIHDPQKLEKRVLRRIKPGNIILLHDVAPAVIPVLGSILVYLDENGYRTRLP